MTSAVKDLIAELSKGKEYSVVLASSEDSPCVVEEWLSTNCLALDYIMGGGLPMGRIVEIYGDTSTGKSLIASQVVAYAQKVGYIVLYMDTEHATSLQIMAAVGVDIDSMIYADPDTIEETFELMEEILLKKDPDTGLLIVWDSIAATTVRLEKDSEYGKATMGRHANVMSQGLRKFNRLISKHNACLLALNQTRDKIGVMFGDKESTFGGKAVSFYASIRLRLKKGKKIYGTEKGKKKPVIGIYTSASVVKNKVAQPFLEAELPILFGHGIDDAGAALLLLKENDVVKVKGAWHSIFIDLKEETKFQKADWPELFKKHYDLIADLILEDLYDDAPDS